MSVDVCACTTVSQSSSSTLPTLLWLFEKMDHTLIWREADEIEGGMLNSGCSFPGDSLCVTMCPDEGREWSNLSVEKEGKSSRDD